MRMHDNIIVLAEYSALLGSGLGLAFTAARPTSSRRNNVFILVF